MSTKLLLSASVLTLGLVQPLEVEANNPYSAISTSQKVDAHPRKKTPVQQDNSLASALVNTYHHNPEIQEGLRRFYAAVEAIPAAKSGWLPTVRLSGSATHKLSDSDGMGDTGPRLRRRVDTDALSARAQINQNIFDGFKTTNEIKQAKASVEAAKYQYIGVEQSVLLKSIQAYLDLWRAYETLNFRKASAEFRLRVLQQIQAQESVGEKNRTDVAEARSRYASSIADRLAAEAGVTAAEATFKQVTGVKTIPKITAMPKRILSKCDIPKTLPSYLDQARSGFPGLKTAEFSLKARDAAIEISRSAVRPSVDLSIVGDRSKTNNATSPGGAGSVTSFNYESAATFQAQVTIPLYSGGRSWSGIRRATQEKYQARYSVEKTLLELIQGVEANWQEVQSNRDSVKQFQVQVDSARLTLEGRRQEYQVGERTLTDTLDAEQQLVSAQVNLVSKQRDYLLSQYRMLSLMGKLRPDNLSLDVDPYDYEGYQNSMTHRHFGTGGLKIPADLGPDAKGE